jgi:ribosomal protein S18 acetylase RimI-like enzyme
MKENDRPFVDIILSKGTLSEHGLLISLKNECIKQMRHSGIDQWDATYPADRTIENDVSAGTLHVLRVERMICGCVTLDEKHDPLWEDMNFVVAKRFAAVVHRLMIHPTHQGNGWSKLLMRYAESIAVERHFNAIHLDAFALNPRAVSLYERLGYCRVGTGTMRKGAFICFEKVFPCTDLVRS